MICIVVHLIPVLNQRGSWVFCVGCYLRMIWLGTLYVCSCMHVFGVTPYLLRFWIYKPLKFRMMFSIRSRSPHYKEESKGSCVSTGYGLKWLGLATLFWFCMHVCSNSLHWCKHYDFCNPQILGLWHGDPQYYSFHYDAEWRGSCVFIVGYGWKWLWLEIGVAKMALTWNPLFCFCMHMLLKVTAYFKNASTTVLHFTRGSWMWKVWSGQIKPIQMNHNWKWVKLTCPLSVGM